MRPFLSDERLPLARVPSQSESSDPEAPALDQQAESERQHIVGIVGTHRDVQEEHQMHAHLCDRQHMMAMGMLGCQTRSVPATKNDVAVRRLARPRPTTYPSSRGPTRASSSSPGATSKWLCIYPLTDRHY